MATAHQILIYSSKPYCLSVANVVTWLLSFGSAAIVRIVEVQVNSYVKLSLAIRINATQIVAA